MSFETLNVTNVPYDQRLQCCALSLQYSFVERKGRLTFEGDIYPDMGSVIDLFEHIDPGVVQIRTFNYGNEDTMYRKQNGKDWEAFLPRMKHK